ncbi:MAG: conjugal transfer protein TraC [Eggerthellaceae bacterium]|nr:conjugal transfer protein TraC [Eggerthellaceae bacterium]
MTNEEQMNPATDMTLIEEAAKPMGDAFAPKGAFARSRKEKRAYKAQIKKEKRELTRKAKQYGKELRQLDKEESKRAKQTKDTLKERGKAKEREAAKRQAKRERATDTLTAIGYERMFKDGICEVEPGLFSQTLEFPDISYQSAREDRQQAIFDVLFEMLNYFNEDVHVQYNVMNIPILREEIGEREFFRVSAQESDAARSDAETFNQILNQKMKEGVSNIRRVRTITYSIEAPSADAAIKSLSRIRNDVADALGRIGCQVKVLDGMGRLELLNTQLRPGHVLSFDYERDITITSGLTTKDFISPEVLDYKRDQSSYWNGDVFCQALVMRTFGSDNSDRMLCELADLPMPLNISWHLSPMGKSKAVNYVKQRLNWIDKEYLEAQQKAYQKGYDPNLLPAELTYSRDEAKGVLDDLQNKNQRLFEFTGLVWTYADSPQELAERVHHIIDKANSHSVIIEALPLRQRAAMNLLLPLGMNHVDVSRMFTTAEAAILVPFATQELDQAGGNYVGQNKVSNNLVIANRKLYDSPVGFVAAKTGGGKSFFVKQEIEGTLLNCPDDQIIIVDRAAEYVALTAHHDGSELAFGVDSPTRLNPFDMSTLGDMSREAQIAFKVDAMLAQAAASAAESGQGLDECEQSIITRAVEIAFANAKRRKTSQIPTLGDFHKVLSDEKHCPEPQAKTIALRYERFVHGSMSFFNAQSNVDWDKRIVDVNLRSLPDSMVVFALINMCEAVRNQMYANHAKGRRTWIYIEEIQSMFAYPTVLSYFSRFANEARKFGGIITGITQNSVAMLENEKARAIVLNADYIMLLKQSPVDRQTWTDLLGLSAEEAGFVDESCKCGDGLLIAGAARVPIKGEFPMGNSLYELFNTDFNEAAA